MIDTAKTRQLAWREIGVTLTYLAAQIIYLNGYVMDHKTTGTFGLAKVVVLPTAAKIMEAYLTYVRQKLTPKHKSFEKRFFLTNTGNEFGNISQHMDSFAESFGLIVPTTGVQRKVVAMEVFKTEDNVGVRTVQKHVCHSATTCHQQMDNSGAVSSKRTIKTS